MKNPLNFKLKRNNIKFLLKIDYSLFKISSNKLNIFKAIITRLLGWISGALEIYVFLMIINVEVSFVDVILIEAFTGLIRSVVFFYSSRFRCSRISLCYNWESCGFE